MAGMMPTSQSSNPYDNDAIERDHMIDPDDGRLPE